MAYLSIWWGDVLSLIKHRAQPPTLTSPPLGVYLMLAIPEKFLQKFLFWGKRKKFLFPLGLAPRTSTSLSSKEFNTWLSINSTQLSSFSLLKIYIPLPFFHKWLFERWKVTLKAQMFSLSESGSLNLASFDRPSSILPSFSFSFRHILLPCTFNEGSLDLHIRRSDCVKRKVPLL